VTCYAQFNRVHTGWQQHGCVGVNEQILFRVILKSGAKVSLDLIYVHI